MSGYLWEKFLSPKKLNTSRRLQEWILVAHRRNIVVDPKYLRVEQGVGASTRRQCRCGIEVPIVLKSLSRKEDIAVFKKEVDEIPDPLTLHVYHRTSHLPNKAKTMI